MNQIDMPKALDDLSAHDSPLVSFIMATFNSAEFVHESIESVLAQTNKNFELIIVDNQSTDETINIVKKLMDNDDRIKLETLNPQGKFPYALERGLAVARGTWVSIIDSDDLLHPEKTQKQLVAVLQNSKICYVGSDALFIDQDGIQIGSHKYPTSHRPLVSNLMKAGAFPPHSSALFNRNVAELISGYNTRFLASEDIDFQLRMAQLGELHSVPEFLVRIRKHAHNLSGSRNAAIAFKFIVIAQTSIRIELKGYSNPTQGTDEEWNSFCEFIESDSKFQKSQMRYVDFCRMLEDASKDPRILSRFIFVAKFFWSSIKSRNFSNGIRKKSMNQIAKNWITEIKF